MSSTDLLDRLDNVICEYHGEIHGKEEDYYEEGVSGWGNDKPDCNPENWKPLFELRESLNE